MKIVLYAILFALLTNCSQKIIQSSKTIEKDSVHVDSVVTRKIIKTKGDSVGFGFKLSDIGPLITSENIKDLKTGEVLAFKEEDPIIFKKTQKNGHLTQSVTISKSGNVKLSCKEDSLQEVINNQRITIKNFKSKVTIETKTIEVEYIPKFYKFCLWWFIGTVALAGVYIGLKLKGWS